MSYIQKKQNPQTSVEKGELSVEKEIEMGRNITPSEVGQVQREGRERFGLEGKLFFSGNRSA